MILEAWDLSKRYLQTPGTKLFVDCKWYAVTSRWNGTMLMEKLISAGLATIATESKVTGKPTSIHLDKWISQAEMEALCLNEKRMKQLDRKLNPKRNWAMLAIPTALGCALIMLPIIIQWIGG